MISNGENDRFNLINSLRGLLMLIFARYSFKIGLCLILYNLYIIFLLVCTIRPALSSS